MVLWPFVTLQLLEYQFQHNYKLLIHILNTYKHMKEVDFIPTIYNSNIYTLDILYIKDQCLLVKKKKSQNDPRSLVGCLKV